MKTRRITKPRNIAGGAVSILVGIAALTVPACRRAEPEHHEESSPPGWKMEVKLSEEAARAAGIETVAVSRETFHPHLQAAGVIRPITDRSVTVRARVGGHVVRVLADVGRHVKGGDPLAYLDGPDVSDALARHRTAAARESAARAALERADRLLGLRAMSGAEVEVRRTEWEATAAEAGAARDDLVRLGLDPADAATAQPGRQYVVRAPMGGVVLERGVTPGLIVEKDAALFAIADLGSVWAIVDVFERDLGRIRDTGEVEIRTDAWPDRIFTGRIALVHPALDDASRTAHLRIAIANRDGSLRPGMFVTAAIPLQAATTVEAMAVPSSAIQTIAGMKVVFVAKGEGVYEVRPVETRREAHGMVEIHSGVGEGERVVTGGTFVLKSEVLKGTIAGDEH